jgi:hypothetical protein
VGTYFHTIIFSAGTYLAFPIGTFTCAPVVLRGVGILRTTLFAFSFPSKFARRCIVYSTRDLVGSVTCVCSLNGKLILDVDRYLLVSTSNNIQMDDPHLMSSNSPSGGMKLIDRSESNLPNRTH